jgi:hypothetical protein
MPVEAIPAALVIDGGYTGPVARPVEGETL